MINNIISQKKESNNNTLKKSNPKLADQWHPFLNGSLTPDAVSCNSHKKVWWLGECGHEWEAEVKSRNQGRGCPFCSGRMVLKGFNDIATTDREYLKEWNYNKNLDVTPFELSAGSHKKVWWKCENGHEWLASPNHRISKKRGCPYCCHNPLVDKGKNDFESMFPELVSEWNYGRNTILPSDVTSHSNVKVWWKCKKGHEWKTSVNHRANGSSCPFCAKGMQTSFPEQAIFFYISQQYPDAKNKYKDIFSGRRFELDVYIPSKQIGIEYDGEAYHKTETQKKRDYEKYEYCKSKSIKLVRVTENKEFDERIADYTIIRDSDLEKTIKELLNYLHINIAVNLREEEDIIRNNYFSYIDDNSLLMVNPDLCEEWDYQKNRTTPDMFLAGSNIKVWWKCKKGHEWKAAIYERNKGKGCPFCSNNKILPGYNDLKTKRPDLMEEWYYEKNTIIGLDPSVIFPGSGKKAWWICKKCGHEWFAEISSRNKGHGCPECNRGWNKR